jgi:putative lipoic acid-binding regulatory protein
MTDFYKGQSSLLEISILSLHVAISHLRLPHHSIVPHLQQTLNRDIFAMPSRVRTRQRNTQTSDLQISHSSMGSAKSLAVQVGARSYAQLRIIGKAEYAADDILVIGECA